MSDVELPAEHQIIQGRACLMDHRGAWVPIENIKAQDLLIHDAVTSIVPQAISLETELRLLKERTLEEAQSLRELILQEYGARIGGAKGNLTLSSFDGAMQIKVAVQDQMDLGPELQAAKALIDECLERWSEGANDNMRVLVNDAFQVRKQGRIDTHRVLALTRLEISDETGTWARAMGAIKDAVRITSTKTYARYLMRERDDQPLLPVVLDIAKL